MSRASEPSVVERLDVDACVCSGHQLSAFLAFAFLAEGRSSLVASSLSPRRPKADWICPDRCLCKCECLAFVDVIPIVFFSLLLVCDVFFKQAF